MVVISGAVEAELMSIDETHQPTREEKDEILKSRMQADDGPYEELRLIITSGGALMVPPFNSYCLDNIGQRDADLYWFYLCPESEPSEKARKILQDDDDEI